MRISDWSSDVCSSDLIDAGKLRNQRLIEVQLDFRGLSDGRIGCRGSGHELRVRLGSGADEEGGGQRNGKQRSTKGNHAELLFEGCTEDTQPPDRKSTRLNSSH